MNRARWSSCPFSPNRQSLVLENQRGAEEAHRFLHLSWHPVHFLLVLSLELKSPDLPDRAGLDSAPVAGRLKAGQQEMEAEGAQLRGALGKGEYHEVRCIRRAPSRRGPGRQDGKLKEIPEGGRRG